MFTYHTDIWVSCPLEIMFVVSPGKAKTLNWIHLTELKTLTSTPNNLIALFIAKIRLAVWIANNTIFDTLQKFVL